jgi:hypothetical protein
MSSVSIACLRTYADQLETHEERRGIHVLAVWRDDYLVITLSICAASLIHTFSHVSAHEIRFDQVRTSELQKRHKILLDMIVLQKGIVLFKYDCLLEGKCIIEV